MKIAFLFDSGSSFQINKEKDCFVLPMVISVKQNGGETTYLDGVNIKREELESLVNSGAQIHTSQPIIGQIIEMIEDLYKTYDMIIAIPFAKSLSSTFNSILSFQKQYGPEKFLIADISAMSITGNWFFYQLRSYLEQHGTITQEQLNKLAEEFKQSSCGAVIVTDTKRLIAGGRLKGLKGLIAKTLKLKLIIKFKEALEFKDKSLHLKDAIDKTLNIIDKDCQFRKYGIKQAAIVISMSNSTLDDDEKYYEYFVEKLNQEGVTVSKFVLPGCVICHTGTEHVAILIEANK